jgi:hypothetical protein
LHYTYSIPLYSYIHLPDAVPGIPQVRIQSDCSGRPDRKGQSILAPTEFDGNWGLPSVNIATDIQQARFNSSAAAGPAQSFLQSRAALLAATAASAGSIAFYTHAFGVPFLPEASANTAAEDGLHPTSYPFEHKGMFETFDHSSIRRGYQGEWHREGNEGMLGGSRLMVNSLQGGLLSMSLSGSNRMAKLGRCLAHGG